MSYELTGKIKLILDPKTFDSGFTKREVVVTVDDGKYPQDICLEFVQDRVSLLDEVDVGDDVTVSFDIRGREFNGRYFNNLQGWKVVPAGAGADDSIAGAEQYPEASGGGQSDAYDDDIPF